MSDRFEMFGEDGKWLVKDNEKMPHLLDLYKCHIRMNEFVDKIADLEAKLAESEKESNARYSAWQEEIVECDRLRVALAEKDSEVQRWKDGTMVVKLGKLEEQLEEKEKECAVWKRAYEYAIFECDFYKNHTQTTTEETMKRIEQLYEKILKRAKSLMEDK